MTAMMADLEGEELYQVRAKIDRDLHRLIEGGEADGEADGDEPPHRLNIRLRCAPDQLQIELVFVQSRFVELRLVCPENPLWSENEWGDFFLITRGQMFDNPKARAMLFEKDDPTGQFEAFLARARRDAA